MNIECARCHHEKPSDEFYANASKQNGYSSYCKVCQNGESRRSKLLQAVIRSEVEEEFEPDFITLRERVEFETLKRGRARRVLKNREKYLKSTYGMTTADYEELKRSQCGECEICTQEIDLVVDHDHVTGRVRGLLCSNCNSGLGFFQDSPTILKMAVSYLESV